MKLTLPGLGILSRENCLVLVSVLVVVPWWRGARDAGGFLTGFMMTAVGVFVLLRTVSKWRAGLWLRRWWWGFVLWSAVSMSWSLNHYQTARALMVLAVATGVFLVAQAVKERSDTWIKAYLWLAAAASMAGVWIYLTGRYERLTSVFYWANPFAAWLLPAVVLGFWNYAKGSKEAGLEVPGRERLSSWARLLQASIIAAAFILTDSRSAALVLAVAIIGVLSVVRLKPPVWRRLAAATVLALALVWGINAIRTAGENVTLTPGARFTEAVRGESNSGNDRWNYLKSTFLIWQDYPWVGTGAGTYASIHPQYQIRTESAAAHAHNYYAQVLAELGVVGFVLLLGVVGALGAGTWESVKRNRQQVPLAMALVLLVVHFGLDIDTQYPAIVWLAAALAGLVYQGREAKAGRGGGRWALALMALMTLPVTSLYRSELAGRWGSDSQQEGDLALAAEWFNRAQSGITYNPDYVTAEGINYLVLAKKEVDRDTNLALALDRANQATRLDPADSQHNLLAARVNVEKRNFDEAARFYRLALEKDPYNEPDLYSELTGVELERGHMEAALEYANQGLGHYSDRVLGRRAADEDLPRRVARLHVSRAAVRLRLGDENGAREDAEKALQWHPESIPAKQIERLLSQN
jgi:O-antigen ligase